MADAAALNAAAQRKRAVALERAIAALNELAEEGAMITFQHVARRDGVSRQWLYRQPELRARIERLRERPSGAPIRERTSEASLRQRLRTVLDDNQTLPNGFCGLPLQQSCPHNACLTCDHFFTTPEHLPIHREQLDRTRMLLADAREHGQQRLIDMNEPVELNLVRIIDGLHRLDQEETADAA